ncbi:MAG: hypothetical protein AB2793_01060 [Candidatus Thiodiazotropha sp.]
MSEAADFIRSAKKLGCKPEIKGEWIIWTPPVPVEMMPDAIRLSDDIRKELIEPPPDTDS